MAVFSTVGSLIASSSQNRNARRAAETSRQNNAENTALAREIYGQNRQVLNPFMQRGNAAGNQINALLGLGGAPMEQGGPANVGPNALSQFLPQNGGTGFNPAAFGDAGLPYGLGDGFVTTGTMNGGMATATGPTNTQLPTAQTPQQAAESAFDIFRNSTGYQFRLGEGMDAINSGYAGAGILQSGAALRGIQEYGQNFASNEFGNYLNALGAQQSVGAGAASSLAGVGQNFASTVINSNNLNAQNQMAAQLGRQNPLANALGTWGGSVQNIFGNMMGAMG